MERKETALRAARREKNITLKELARKSAVSYSRLRQIDAGEADATQARTRFLISLALGDRKFKLWPEDARADLHRLADLQMK